MSRNFGFFKLTLCWLDSGDQRTCIVHRNRLLEEVDASFRRLGLLFRLFEQSLRVFQIFQLSAQVFGDCLQFFPLNLGSSSQRSEMVPTTLNPLYHERSLPPNIELRHLSRKLRGDERMSGQGI